MMGWAVVLPICKQPLNYVSSDARLYWLLMTVLDIQIQVDPPPSCVLGLQLDFRVEDQGPPVPVCQTSRPLLFGSSAFSTPHHTTPHHTTPHHTTPHHTTPHHTTPHHTTPHHTTPEMASTTSTPLSWGGSASPRGLPSMW